MFDISNTCLKKGCLDGEVAVITGSTSNVGKGFAFLRVHILRKMHEVYEVAL